MTSAGIHPLNEATELTELNGRRGLYLKPIARINISVKLPQMKDPGKSISNWDIMEKLKKTIRPNEFAAIRVSKSTLEFVRFEADLDSRSAMDSAIEVLDNSALKVIGFFETLPVRAAEAKSTFPTRHDWDSFFRDAKNMNELKAGERPDTLHIKGLPIKWFLDPKEKTDKGRDRERKPCESELRSVFATFGEIRAIDIPMLDPYRREMTGVAGQFSGLKTFNFTQELTFEAYIQYVEYIGFVKAMDGLRGLKLVHKDADDSYQATTLTVTFDKTKHMSDKNMRKRRIERERLQELERQREEKARKQREIEEKRAEQERLELEQARLRGEAEKFQRRRQREEKRRLRRIEKKRKSEEQKLDLAIALEERKILVAQRRLESCRLLTELFKRAVLVVQRREVERELEELEEATKREAHERMVLERAERDRKGQLLQKRESQLRQRVTASWMKFQNRRFLIRRGVAMRRFRGVGYRFKSVSAAQAGPGRGNKQQMVVPRIYGYKRPGSYRGSAVPNRRFFRGPRGWRGGGNFRGGYRRIYEPEWSPTSRPPPPFFKEREGERMEEQGEEPMGRSGDFFEDEEGGLGSWDDDHAGFVDGD